MKLVFLNDPEYAGITQGLCTRAACPAAVEEAAAKIVHAVRAEGNKAIAGFLHDFDHVDLTPAEFRVSGEEIAAARSAVKPSDRKAIALALKNIRTFALKTKPHDWKFQPRKGVTLGEQYKPMRRVACYVPGGTAPLVSTAIHTVAIAKAAGVDEVVAMTPPMKNGKVNPATLYALKKAGADEIYKFGGAYAIAALAYGTETIRKADKIVGPGNAYVAAAKKIVYGTVAIDMVAGPSEVMVIADKDTDPVFAAADILSQAEHGSGLEQAVLVSDDAKFLKKAQKEILKQAQTLTRQGPLRKVLDNGVYLIQVKDMDDAARFAGEYAPEHLEIQSSNPEKLAKKIRAAGAIFMGPWTPEPAGDFTAGPSHVLPTGGTAKFFHGLTAADFVCRSSLLKFEKSALLAELPAIAAMANLEGLDAHARSALVRGAMQENED